jgi:hypothetical protein
MLARDFRVGRVDGDHDIRLGGDRLDDGDHAVNLFLHPDCRAAAEWDTADIHPIRAVTHRYERRSDGRVETEGAACVEEGVRRSVDDGHDRDLPIEIESACADLPGSVSGEVHNLNCITRAELPAER